MNLPPVFRNDPRYVQQYIGNVHSASETDTHSILNTCYFWSLKKVLESQTDGIFEAPKVQNAHFQLAKTSVLGLFSRKLGLWIRAQADLQIRGFSDQLIREHEALHVCELYKHASAWQLDSVVTRSCFSLKVWFGVPHLWIMWRGEGGQLEECSLLSL
jgi:hypothetical protein